MQHISFNYFDGNTDKLLDTVNSLKHVLLSGCNPLKPHKLLQWKSIHALQPPLPTRGVNTFTNAGSEKNTQISAKIFSVKAISMDTETTIKIAL